MYWISESLGAGARLGSGVGALEFITNWYHDVHLRFPDYNFYENGLNLLVQKRLPLGASPAEFDAIVGRFVQDINPFLRAPFSGDSLGEFILEKLPSTS